jgi:hypothetical protein
VSFTRRSETAASWEAAFGGDGKRVPNAKILSERAEIGDNAPGLENRVLIESKHRLSGLSGKIGHRERTLGSRREILAAEKVPEEARPFPGPWTSN